MVATSDSAWTTIAHGADTNGIYSLPLFGPRALRSIITPSLGLLPVAYSWAGTKLENYHFGRVYQYQVNQSTWRDGGKWKMLFQVAAKPYFSC